jgi:molybdopterin-guanine dinucleotide biosynthesis protein A
MSVIAGVLLAGGQSRRMGSDDKCLLSLGSATLLDIAIERLRPQVNTLMLSVNGDPSRFADWDLPLATDVVGDYSGPLAGILTGMVWCAEHCPDAEWVLSAASDTPFFPRDLAARLLARAQADRALISVAESGGRLHPVFGLWHRSLEENLREALVERDVRKMRFWLEQHPWTRTCFGAQNTVDPFFNINSPGDLELALKMTP